MSDETRPKSAYPLVKVIGRDDPAEVLASGHTFGGFRSKVETVAVRFPLDGLCAYYDEDMVEPWDGEAQ
jgi:hypothetical protein